MDRKLEAGSIGQQIEIIVAVSEQPVSQFRLSFFSFGIDVEFAVDRERSRQIPNS